MQAVTVKEYDAIPAELTERKQWVLWKLENVQDKNGKQTTTKVPYQICGNKAGSTNPATWTSYNVALQSSEGYSGLGYVLTDADPYTVIDLDDCIIDGKMTDEAKLLVDTFDSYTEYSQSGNGLHIFIAAKKPGKRSKNPEKNIELYDSNRFMVMTGNHLEGTPKDINARQGILDYVYDMYFQAEETKPVEVKTDMQLSPQLSDEEVLKIAFKAKNGEVIRMLHSGNFEKYSSQSEADQALCNYIAFYTQDYEQIDRIFTNSGLYREKWDREDYKSETIQKAVSGLGATYQKGKREKSNFHIQFSDELANSPVMDLEKVLQARRFEELDKIYEELMAEWEAEGGSGKAPKKPTTLSPVRCALILPEYVNFVLFDLEENTRLAMYQPKDGTYTRNVTIIKRVISWLEPKLNNMKANDVIYYLTNTATLKEKTDSRYLIPVNNGIFNLKTKKLEPFNPDYVFTTKISTDYIENPNLPIIDGWNVEEWIDSVACYDEEVIRLLWQVINDSLNGNYTRKKAIFLVGGGLNGKGTFQDLITNLIGIHNIATLKINDFDKDFHLSVLEGKTAVIGDDLPAGVHINDSSNFNSVVTGDPVLVNIKNGSLYTATYRCTVIQSTNGMPTFKNKTQGTLRRVLIVPFKADFNGGIENFDIKEKYIRDERVLQYVLHKAINLDFSAFDIPKVSENELEVFKQDNDPILDFKLSVFDAWGISEVPKPIVYEFYKRFCENNNFKPLSNRKFHHQLKSYLSTGWIDGQKRFRYEDLLPYVGDLDMLGIGFPDQNIPQTTYRKV